MGPSSAGAVGWMQFLPSTWDRWAVDANGDGVANPSDPADAIFTAARYLAASGAGTNLPGAIFSYNHAQWYVDEVLSIANTISTDGTILVGGGYSGTAATTGFTADPMVAVRVHQARQELDAAKAQLAQAQADEQQTGTAADTLDARIDGAELLSDRLDIQKQAVLAGVRHDAASAAVAAAQSRVDDATAALEQARSSSAQSLFQPGVAPSDVHDGYVFPVGGGPSQVSVAHTHHDYPAADIAAPLGSPVYALTNAVVEDAWQQPDPRCGIGLTLVGSDGLSWTYCHLSYLDPAVVAGSALTAGQAIGRVGQTGDATGPHLHLQLNPQFEYPQVMPWFESFAGTAFSWQDAPTPVVAPTTPSAAPVFAVVPDASTPDVITFTAR
jgi:murein DD-endopeptidase MepM/ murein hydrolase activator NlpD